MSGAVATLAALTIGCAGGGEIVDRLRPTPASEHERYAEALADAGLDAAALGRDWLAAADSVLRTPLPVSLPFRERAFFSADQATAVAYDFAATRGQQLRVAANPEGDARFLVFVDLFEQPEDSTEALVRRASADVTMEPVVFDVRRTGRYQLRVQPELLRSGGVTVSIETGPSLAFPVEGRDSRAIQSRFGVARDGGRREHHGVDIFAPRGTPVIAATRGVIRSTTPNTLGGIVVWLSDQVANQSLYYAHLDTQVVAPGMRVEPGDTLGFVGNSGNARTTPPHLHFGIYARGEGPIDPFPYIRESRTDFTDIVGADSLLGAWVRTRVADATVYHDPSRAPGPRRTIARGTPIRVRGATGLLLRVDLPDGTRGFVSVRDIEPAAAQRRHTVASGAPLRDRPAPAAPVIALADSTSVTVLGRYGDYALVRTVTGRAGWVEMD